MPEAIPPDLLDLRERIQRFAEEELRPLEEQSSDDDEYTAESELRREVARRSREAGFFGMTQPKEFGGSEAGPLALTVAREAFAATNLRTAGWVFGPGPGVLRICRAITARWRPMSSACPSRPVATCIACE